MNHPDRFALAFTLRVPAFVSAALVCFACSAAFAQKVPVNYTDDMPSVAKVEQQIKGTDPTDTLERQVAVFEYLQIYIQRIKETRDYRGPYTPAEAKLRADYAKAQYDLQQSYNRTHTQQEIGAFSMKEGQYSENNALDWIKQLQGNQAAVAYTNTEADLKASGQKMYNQHMQDLQQAREAQKRAASQGTAMVNGRPMSMSNDPSSVAVRRCLELGGSTGSCMGGGLINAMISFTIGGEGTESLTGPGRAGVALSGAYESTQPGAYVNFLGDSGAITNCGKLVADGYTYTLSKTASSLKVTLSTSPSPVILTMRSDGSLQGPGAITLNGRIITGYEVVTTTRTGNCAPNCVTTTRTPIYAPATDRCSIGALKAPAPAPPPSANGSGTPQMGGLVGGVIDTLTGAMTATMPGAAKIVNSLPGLRMEGKYTSSGLLLDFAGDAVTIDCGAAHVKAPYTVENAPSSLIVHVRNSGGPFDLVVSSDNTLRGSGSTTVNGKLVSGMNGTDITFTPHSETCQVGSYTPQRGSGATTMVAANASAAPAAPASPATFRTTAAPQSAAIASSGSMTLSITSSFPVAKNPLAGRVVKLMTDRFDNVLRNAGAPVPAGTTPGQALQGYSTGCPPPTGCPVLAQKAKQYYVGTATFDNNGSATLSAEVPPGSYYILCAAPGTSGALVWDMPVTLAAGQKNSIQLTATNAELVK